MFLFVKKIPNILTLCNLLCGVVGILFLSEGRTVEAAWIVGIALVFDTLDGVVARLMKATSPLGKELDSLADVVSFGVLPGLLGFTLIQQQQGEIAAESMQWLAYLPYLAFIIPICAALRLARFNISASNNSYFTGLPVPPPAIFFAALTLICTCSALPYAFQWVLHPYALIAFAWILSLLMVSSVKMYAIKIDPSTPRKYIVLAVVILILMGLMMVFLQYSALPIIISLYVIANILTGCFKCCCAKGCCCKA